MCDNNRFGVCEMGENCRLLISLAFLKDMLSFKHYLQKNPLCMQSSSCSSYVQEHKVI